MFKRLVSLGLAVAVLVGVVATGAVAGKKAESDFDRLLRLAYIADAQFDSLPDAWDTIKPGTWDEFDALVITIIGQLVEEGVSQGVFPSGIVFVEYGFVTRSMIAGTYSPDRHLVGLNSRYLSDAVWTDINYWSVLVHELIHAQGYHNETETEAMTMEVMAALANLNYPGFEKDFWDGIRRDALSVAYYIAAYGGALIHTTDPNDFGDLCLANCTYSPDKAQMARLEAARSAIFTEDELRRSDKRLRFWTDPLLGNQYLFVLAQYAVKPMAIMLDVVCDGAYPKYEHQFTREFGSHGITVKRAQPFFTLDDVAYLLRGAKFCT